MVQPDIIIGKHTLESLTIGMYADPFTIYREYIQNSTDSIDNAVKAKILDSNDARIDVVVDPKKSLIVIRDNGTGINPTDAYKVLGDIGNSSKDYRENRGFRGIGRLGGLGYAKKLSFSTSAKGDKQKITITWDCEHLKELLRPGKYNNYDLVKVIREVTSFKFEDTDRNSHFFEVQLQEIDPSFPELLNTNQVESFLANVAPIPFNCQAFIEGKKIKKYFQDRKLPIEEYYIHLNGSPKPIHKKYTSSFRTGHQERNKQEDKVNDIEFFELKSEDGYTYVGWHAISNFYGSVVDEFMSGIRIRKGNILIGTEDTFSQFFPSEKDVANSWFIGEVYIFDKDIIPNARRDDFEKNSTFQKMFVTLSEKADFLNKQFRRQMSRHNSLIKGIDDCKKEITQINKIIDTGGITSDVKKEQLIEKKEEIEKKIEIKQKELQKVADKYSDGDTKKEIAKQYIKEADILRKQIVTVENRIINADYATKKDLPSSYSKEERHIYQLIIKVIDENLDDETAKMLRKKIIEELSISKKRR